MSQAYSKYSKISIYIISYLYSILYNLIGGEMSKSDINHKVGDVIRVYDDVRDEWSDQIVLTPGFAIQNNWFSEHFRETAFF